MEITYNKKHAFSKTFLDTSIEILVKVPLSEGFRKALKL